jgi:hypothetical protein
MNQKDDCESAFKRALRLVSCVLGGLFLAVAVLAGIDLWRSSPAQFGAKFQALLSGLGSGVFFLAVAFRGRKRRRVESANHSQTVGKR